MIVLFQEKAEVAQMVCNNLENKANGPGTINIETKSDDDSILEDDYSYNELIEYHNRKVNAQLK